MSPFYITTPIYYPNGEPHLGHLYTTLAADTLARYHRLTGDRVHFLTGTDEHGVKMVKTAAERNTTPLALATEMSDSFRATFARWHVANDDFIRTTEPRHTQRVAEIVRRMIATGDIYLGSYQGWYDEGQEEFVTETAAKDQDYKSAISGRPLTRYSEPTYFFKLSAYIPRVTAAIESGQLLVRPESRRNEVLSKLRMGVDDLSISRASLRWGIPMPNDPDHVLYVWIDALSNYITAVGLPDTPSDFWPADVHLIGKEILWFHVVYWPAMLMALGLPLPKQVFAHGWWTAEGKKMSKTMGNFIDLARLDDWAALYGQDTVRFHLLRAAPFGSDLDFKAADLLASLNELANVLGNLLNRVLNMVGKYRAGVLPAITPTDADAPLLAQIAALPAALRAAYSAIELQQAVTLPLDVARAANAYIDVTRPFSLAKDPANAERLDTILALSARAVTVALIGLLPVLPEKAAAGLSQLNIASEGRSLDDLLANPPAAGHILGTGVPLFPKPL